jgi:hypothetical protein
MRGRLFCRISLVIGFEHGRLHLRGEALARCVIGLLNWIDVYTRNTQRSQKQEKSNAAPQDEYSL